MADFTLSDHDINPEVAQAGLNELSTWCELNTRILEISPKAMAAAYRVMAGLVVTYDPGYQELRAELAAKDARIAELEKLLG